MKEKLLKLTKITNNKWLNMFKMKYINKKNEIIEWEFSSRRDKPVVGKEEVIDAVVIAPFIYVNNEKKLVLIKEFRPVIWSYIYDLPAGMVEKGQTTLEAAKKELREETGLFVKRIISVSPILYSAPGTIDESYLIYSAEVEGTISNNNTEKTETISVHTFNTEELIELLKTSPKMGGKAWLVACNYLSEIR